jgi:tetratricopeptide (TPR) repeat protein
MALFYRAFMFHQLAQLFCEPYSTSTAGNPGIVLRTTAETDAPIARSTVQQSYDQIINDLKTAAELLPASQLYTTRPNKAAVYGELARVYLSMRDYVNAEAYASNVLAGNSVLIDYNSLSPASNPVLPTNPINNPEILFISRTTLSGVFSASHEAIVDTSLYRSYNTNDLRKTVFFGLNGSNNYWKGSYYAFGGLDYSIFDGLATDEIYLIRAECRARKGDANAAMDDLNTLLRNRWKTGSFTNIVAIDANDALTQVLKERRKELAFRGLRWSDCRRLNLEGANIALTRVVNGTTYTLPANDLRWALLIPDLEINRSAISQNPR